MYSFLYLSLSQVISTVVWCFGLYILFKRLKNLWVGLDKFNFIFNVLITWNKCINFMFLSGFLFWNHTHLNSTGKLEKWTPAVLLSISSLPIAFSPLVGLLQVLHVRLWSYVISAPVLPGWVVSRRQWSDFGIFLLWSFSYALMLALPMLLWKLNSPKNIHVLAEGVLRDQESLVLRFPNLCPSFLLTSLFSEIYNLAQQRLQSCLLPTQK